MMRAATMAASHIMKPTDPPGPTPRIIPARRATTAASQKMTLVNGWVSRSSGRTGVIPSLKVEAGAAGGKPSPPERLVAAETRG